MERLTREEKRQSEPASASTRDLRPGGLFVYQELLVKKKKISEPKPDLFIVFSL